jgi:hypothetical protein
MTGEDEARWRADVIEQLRRINIGIEALNRSNDSVLRQLVEIGARTEAALQVRRADLAGGAPAEAAPMILEHLD